MARWTTKKQEVEPIKLERETQWVIRIIAMVIIAALGLGAGWLGGIGLGSIISPSTPTSEVQTKPYEPPVPPVQNENTSQPQVEPEARARPVEPAPQPDIIDEVEQGIERGVRTGKSLRKFLKKLKKARENRRRDQ